jgi:hypothetical protein
MAHGRLPIAVIAAMALVALAAPTTSAQDVPYPDNDQLPQGKGPNGFPVWLNYSPGFGGGLFVFLWVGEDCEVDAYVPPTPLLYPGPGDPLPAVWAYGCVP